MNNLPTKWLLSLAIIIGLTGCNPKLLSYKLDPDFGQLEHLAGNAQIVAVKISDQRAESSLPSGDVQLTTSENEAQILNDRLTDQLKAHDYKIINNPLLADLALMIDINELSLAIETSTFKSTLKANSVFTLTVRSNGEQWSKIFRSARTQEVANPVNENDATGVINQLLSKQLSAAFSDPALMEFLSKSPQQADF